jgi:hypothetical protein
MKEIEKKKIQDAALKIWPECPEEYLEEAFFFKNQPTAEWVVHVGKSAQTLGTTWQQAQAFENLMLRIEKVEHFALLKFPCESMENILLEIHSDFMRAIQFASLWKNPQHPLDTSFSVPKFFENAFQRSVQAVETMYGSASYIDDKQRSISMFLENKD